MPENTAKNWPVNPPKLHRTTFTTLLPARGVVNDARLRITRGRER